LESGDPEQGHLAQKQVNLSLNLPIDIQPAKIFNINTSQGNEIQNKSSKRTQITRDE